MLQMVQEWEEAEVCMVGRVGGYWSGGGRVPYYGLSAQDYRKTWGSGEGTGCGGKEELYKFVEVFNMKPTRCGAVQVTNRGGSGHTSPTTGL